MISYTNSIAAKYRSIAAKYRFSILSLPLYFAAFACFSQVGSAQVVQLPTFQVFNVSTAVKVPDGGYMRLGGVNSRSAGATTRGVPGLSNVPGLNRLFKNRGIGSETTASNVGVTANIIILEEYEEKVMAEARRRQAARAEEIALQRQADRISRNVGRNRK